MKTLLFALLMGFGLTLSAQYNSEAAVVKVTLTTEAEASGNLAFTVTPKSGWHVYSVQESAEGAYQATVLTLDDNCKGVNPIGELAEQGKMDSHFDDIMGGTLRYFDQKVIFSHLLGFTGGDVVASGTFEYMACNDKKCIPFTVNFSVEPGQ